jgi:hypothetical protein
MDCFSAKSNVAQLTGILRAAIATDIMERLTLARIRLEEIF